MKKAIAILLILAGCSSHKYIVSVDTGNLAIVKTNEIDTVQSIVSKHLSLNVDSVLNTSDYFGYYQKGLEIYFERKNR